MSILPEIGACSVHLSLGLTILMGLACSEYSGVATLLAIPIAACSATLTAFCGDRHPNPLASPRPSYKRRKCEDCLDFFRIWFEILEILAAASLCARIASATVDYISGGRLREWFLGIESHSLGEPWPDVIGVSIVLVITALFMLGLDKSQQFAFLLMAAIGATFTFFVAVGSQHLTISYRKWGDDFRAVSPHSVLKAATMAYYGFTSTFPLPIPSRCKFLKIMTLVVLPLLIYAISFTIFSRMAHYSELRGTATPLLRVFELRDVSWARLVMAICIITIVCLSLTEILPPLYSHFVALATDEWQIFLTLLQYRNETTGAPVLAIFASGSFAAILAFACPVIYLVRVLNAAALLKNTIRAVKFTYLNHKPEFSCDDGDLLPSVATPHYSQLKPSGSGKNSKFVVGLFRSKSMSKMQRGKEDECLLLNEYVGRAMAAGSSSDSEPEFDEEKESILSESESDVDAIVQEYRDKVHVATVDEFGGPTRCTFCTVVALTGGLMAATVALSFVMRCEAWGWAWFCLGGVVLAYVGGVMVPGRCRVVLPACAFGALSLNVMMLEAVLEEVWPGVFCWGGAGVVLFWRWECCYCNGLVYDSRRMNSGEQLIDTILVAR